MATGHIQPQGKGSWRVFIPTGERYESGAPKYHTATIRGLKRDAEAYCADMLARLNKGEPLPDSKLKVSAFFDRWEAYIDKKGLSPNTIRGYKKHIRLYLRPKLGKYLLRKLTPDIIQDAYHDLLAKGLSALTVRNAHRTLRAALQQACKWQLITTNVAKLTDPPRAHKKKFRQMTVEEAKHFLRVTRGRPCWVYWLTLLLLALRRSELLGIRIPDIDLDRLVVKITQGLVHGGKEPEFWIKSDASEAELPLLPILAAEFERVIKQRENERAYLGEACPDLGENGPLLFTDPLGYPRDVSHVNKAFREDLEFAGLPHMRLHDLRHTSISLLLDLGVDLKTVSAIARHAGVQITADTYGHISMARKKAAMQELAVALLGEEAVTDRSRYRA
ncbi:MAG: tyrosine-type recombinase/integrase [Bacteroidota bacterium]